MPEFLLGAAGFVLAMVALGLVRVLYGPGDADRMMAAQLLGTGGIAAVLLLGGGHGGGRGHRRGLDARPAGGVCVHRLRQGCVRAGAATKPPPDDAK